MAERHFYPLKDGARWSTVVPINGTTTVCLIQNSHVYRKSDVTVVLRALGIEDTMTNRDKYFPMNSEGKRCPTLDLLEECHQRLRGGAKSDGHKLV